MEISDINTPAQNVTSEVELDVADLRQGTKWSPIARDYLTSCGDAVQLRSVIDRQGLAVYEHNRWVCQQMADYVNEHMVEINELRLAVVCAQFGVPAEVGRRMMEERTERERAQPVQ